MVLLGQFGRKRYCKTLIVVSFLRILLRQKANVAEKTKMQNKCTLENVNKYEHSTSVSYIKSIIIALENFINAKYCDFSSFPGLEILWKGTVFA